MKPYFLLFAIAYSYCSNANCLLTKVSIDNRTKNSETIIDGQVTEQHSCWNADRSAIYTVNTIQVNKILKGNSPATIEVVTPGGELDGKLLVVEPNADLHIGSDGIFFLNENTNALDYSSRSSKFEIYALAQGFISTDPFSGICHDPFDVYANKHMVYEQIQKTTGINYRESIPTNDNDVSGDASISLFTPATISAGTQSVLTISGWGFGTRKGAATVQFRDANSTSSTVYSSIPDSTYILSWTDTEIKVIVPGASANRQGGAGTGAFNVVTSAGTIISSFAPLNISYNQFEYKKNKISLIDQNGTGGYTFTLNSDLDANAAAKASFTKALDQWKCNTGVNITLAPTTTTTTCSNQLDNMNIISFASSSCALPAGALAVTYSSYTLCAGSPIIPDGIDMIFSPTANFYFGSDATPLNQYDFESVALHELGHAFGEGHSSNNSEIMYPSIANGVSKRILNPATDIISVNDIIARSAANSYCGYSRHRLQTTNCNSNAQMVPITTQFSADKTIGCAPLTVNFSDQSMGAPTSWRWDISNDGTTEYTTQNPSHTFTTAGTYTVKMVALNATAKDSIVKTAVITVAPALKLNLNIVQNISCFGNNNGSIQATPIGGNGTYSYTWSNSKNTSTISDVAAGEYTVTVRDGYNCTSSGSKTLSQPNKLKVVVNTELISDNNYSATLDITGGTAPYTYTLNNNNIVSGSNSISNLNAGNYTLIVKDKNSCIQNATFSIEAPTGVMDVENKFDQLEVFPNPASNYVNINLSLKEYKTVKLELFNLSGQTIYQDEFENIRDKQTSVDLSNLSAGTYILKFGLPEGNTFRKIIVNK